MRQGVDMSRALGITLVHISTAQSSMHFFHPLVSVSDAHSRPVELECRSIQIFRIVNDQLIFECCLFVSRERKQLKENELVYERSQEIPMDLVSSLLFFQISQKTTQMALYDGSL